MKNSQLRTLGIFALLAPALLQSQQTMNACAPPAAYTAIHANNILAGLPNGGDLFWDFSNAQFIPDPAPGAPNPSTIFAAGLWIGGIDPAHNLKLAASTYRPGGATDYWAGPLDASGTTDALACFNWDRHFRAKGADIKAFLDDLPNLVNNPSTAFANYKDIMGWPGRGNPHFASIWGFDLPFTSQGLAPFFDENADGVYNPLDGDYPAVQLQGKPLFVPAEMVWCVFNDQGGGAVHSTSQGQPAQIEVQLMVWAFNCFDQPVLNNTVFTAHKIINRGNDQLDSCFVGLWVDFEIGCKWDDYIGSAPGLDAFYAYNSDVVDGGGNCPNSFDYPPPVQSVTFLNRSLDKFVYYNNPGVGSPLAATTDPTLPLEYYRYLTGHWRDGVPLTHGGSGYNPVSSIPANHAFPDPPSVNNGWSMCTVDLPFSVQRTLGSSKIPQLAPGALAELVTAWTVHFNADLPCNLGETLDNIAFLHNTFDNDFAGVCSGLTALHELPDAAVRMFPNPAKESVSIVYGDLRVRRIRLFAPDGKLVRTLQNIEPEQTVLQVATLDSGVYYIHLLTERGIAVKKMAVLR